RLDSVSLRRTGPSSVVHVRASRALHDPGDGGGIEAATQQETMLPGALLEIRRWLAEAPLPDLKRPLPLTGPQRLQRGSGNLRIHALLRQGARNDGDAVAA